MNFSFARKTTESNKLVTRIEIPSPTIKRLSFEMAQESETEKRESRQLTIVSWYWFIMKKPPAWTILVRTKNCLLDVFKLRLSFRLEFASPQFSIWKSFFKFTQHAPLTRLFSNSRNENFLSLGWIIGKRKWEQEAKTFSTESIHTGVKRRKLAPPNPRKSWANFSDYLSISIYYVSHVCVYFLWLVFTFCVLNTKFQCEKTFLFFCKRNLRQDYWILRHNLHDHEDTFWWCFSSRAHNWFNLLCLDSPHPHRTLSQSQFKFPSLKKCW